MKDTKKLLQPLEAKNDLLSKIQLGYLYDNGWLVGKDYLKAWTYYWQAANMEAATITEFEMKCKVFAMLNLGKLYFFGGYGITSNQDEAFKWIDTAIEIGNVSIATELKDYQEKIQLLSKEADPNEVELATTLCSKHKLFTEHDIFNTLFKPTTKELIKTRLDFASSLHSLIKHEIPDLKYFLPECMTLLEPEQEYKLLSGFPRSTELFEVANYRMAHLLANLSTCLKIFPDTVPSITDQKVISHLMCSGDMGKPMLSKMLYESVHGRGVRVPECDENVFTKMPSYNHEKPESQNISTLFMLNLLRKDFTLQKFFAKEKATPLRKSNSAPNLLRLNG